MQRSKNSHLVKQAFSAVLLFGFTFVASGAEQMMRALPAPAAVQSTTVAPTVLSPATMPSGPPVAPMPAKILPPPSQGSGSVYLSPAAACGMDSTPRISSINGRSSVGIVFKPGDSLNIAGCGFGGFGKGGQVSLSGVGSLIIDGWDDASIHAHIDPAVSRVPDLVGNVKLNVNPNGAPVISSQVGHSFRAARETIQLLLPSSVGIYSQIYNGVETSMSPDKKSTIVARGFQYKPYCPAVTDQNTQMVDIWPVGFLFSDQFEVVGTNYENQTDQHNTDGNVYQYVLVGNKGGAIYDAGSKRVIVTFQGNSRYLKKDVAGTLLGYGRVGTSWCTSRYTVSLTLNGPRGVDPYKLRQ